MDVPKASNMPSGLIGRAAGTPSAASPTAGFSPRNPSQAAATSPSPLPILIASLALVVALAALFVAFTIPSPLSSQQKQELKEISDALRSLQSKDITMTTPIRTTVYINKSFPLQDIFPPTFSLPISFNIPVNAQIVGISSSGQPVIFRVNESVPIVASVPIDSEKTFGNSFITIQKDIPIDSRFDAAVSIRAAYGSELNKIIDKLDQLAQ